MTLRDIPSELQNHLSDDSTTMANCWKVTRNDGVVFRFTDCDVEVQLSDGIYTPISSGSASAIENTADLSTANLTITQILDSEYITIDDINAGLFDGARISIYWVNYKDPGQGIITLFVGFFGEITMRDDNDFDVELKSISTKLEQTVVRQYTQQCDAELGDSRCGVSGELYTVSGEITSVVSNKKFKCMSVTDTSIDISGETTLDRRSTLSGELLLVGSGTTINGETTLSEGTTVSGEAVIIEEFYELNKSEDWFRYGVFEFTSGLNSGQKYEIKGFSGNLPIYTVDTNSNVFEILGNEVNEFNVGDTFDVINSSGNDGTYTVSAIEYDDCFGYLKYDGTKYDVYAVGAASFTTLGLDLKNVLDQKAEDNDDFEVMGENFQILGSKEYDGDYQMRSVSESDGNTKVSTERIGYPHYVGITKITTEESISDSTADGEISYAENGIFELWLSPPFKVQVGDGYEAMAGCDKYFDTCKNKFNNVVNFRGFPHLPGRDSISKYPDSKR